ncbi:hypothetical protein FO519_000691 [Halicephalobus sp. NKZ332]|nr:hypothetical protein FO519_000691 [Halicephalobus sp. NKZ332]
MAAAPSNSTFSRRKLPPWKPHQDGDAPKLYLLNSFTRQKEIFKPITGNEVKFYICGPTVYDSSHMGHARSYLSLDILRRVLSHYFNYDVMFVMNITDVDDKIIKRARQNWLFERYANENRNNFHIIGCDVIKALEAFRSKVEVETDPDKKGMLTTILNRVHNAVVAVESQLKDETTVAVEGQCQELLTSAKDVLSDWLDVQFGDTVTDHSIFSALSRKYESEFLQDMKVLNVMPPNILTRVSEYIPEIIEYVERIIKNGYAYTTADGSFQANEKHFYAKLVPEAVGDSENEAKHMKESEGELSLGVQEKRNPSDFALWKASKRGEPFWDSPWGKGRPGWHIECSAMSTTVCGRYLDIHAGGFDLKFPHHDNEIAQCEAYFDESQWTNFFLHCGTLRIAGSKMSKSLKNFISIKNALEKYTSRQLRILFLMHNWSDVLDYSDQTMERACQFERITKEFFLLVKDIARKKKAISSDESALLLKFGGLELDVFHKFHELKADIHAALCDSIDTRTVIEKIRAMINIGNEYITKTEANDSTNADLLMLIAKYITGLLRIFGVIPEHNDIGFPTESTGTDTGDKEELLMPYLNALANFRENVRNMARTAKNKDILEECDRIRDDILPELGVRLEDRSNQTCKRIPPEEWFQRGPEAGKYSQYDDKGIPTHLVNGDEISKGARGKLVKAWEKQKSVYEKTVEDLKA